MAKLKQIQRLLYIVELLRNKPNGITFEETKDFLEKRFEEKGFELKFSEKTFKPVSYTHLDVYKRQSQHFANTFSVSGKAMTTQPDRQIGFFLIFCILVIA